MQRVLRYLALTLAIAACEPRGNIAYDLAPDQPGTVETVFIGSTRAYERNEGGFGPRRDPNLRYAEFEVSIPPDHKAGEIEWPRGNKVDAATDFVTRRETIFPDATDFRSSLRGALQKLPRKNREAVIFVHGYNNTFAEALYRVAQLKHDLDIPGIAVSYAWPSLAQPLGYAYDRDSVLFARDGMQDLMQQVAEAGAERIILVAHSMGTLLTMETLREIGLEGNNHLKDKIGGVVLISPDIDLEVFQTQVRDVGRLPQPFIVFTSKNDKILRLSARVSGDGVRLGELENVSLLKQYPITFIDVSAFYQGGTGHFTVGNSPSLIKVLDKLQKVDGAFVSDRTKKLGLADTIAMTVQDATRIVLSPLSALTGQPQ